MIARVGYDHERDEVFIVCRLCGGPLTTLGTLGKLEWMRCRNCGADQCMPQEEAERIFND